jgi:hypothetical protein
LIRAGEGDGYLRPPERGRDRWLNGHDFTTGSFLLPPAGQSAEEDVDGLVSLLEAVVVAVLLLALFVVRVWWLWRILERVPELVALLGGVVAVWVPRHLSFSRSLKPPEFFFEFSFAGRWIAATVLSGLRLRLGPE